jgi:hypothetical protein
MVCGSGRFENRVISSSRSAWDRKMTATKRKRMQRTLYRHDWATLDEWAKTLDELAELDDDEIESLVRIAANDADEDMDD